MIQYVERVVRLHSLKVLFVNDLQAAQYMVDHLTCNSHYHQSTTKHRPTDSQREMFYQTTQTFQLKMQPSTAEIILEKIVQKQTKLLQTLRSNDNTVIYTG